MQTLTIKKGEAVLIFILSFIVLTGIYLVTSISAEQHEGTPKADSTSFIKELTDELTTLGYGSTDPGSWGNAGPMWNRIFSAGLWVPELADAQESDVVQGKQFYAGPNRTIKTGAFQTIDWEKQSLLQRDNRDSTDYGETSTWTKTNNDPEVWYDEVTALYWSPSQGTMSNVFDRSTCVFYSTEPRGAYNGASETCDAAINHCATLSLATHTDGSAKTDWYLPSQLELMQAYINGIYKKTSTGWVTTSVFWSSTESQHSTNRAWYTTLGSGLTSSPTKGTIYSVRCVLRDL